MCVHKGVYPMKKELRQPIELLEQKMFKSPNNMNNGGSHFLFRRERMIRLKMLRKIYHKKCSQNGST